MAKLGTGAPLARWAGICLSYSLFLYVGGVFIFSCGAYLGDCGLLVVVLIATVFVILLGGLSLARLLNPVFTGEL
jgi:hypothetical protein